MQKWKVCSGALADYEKKGNIYTYLKACTFIFAGHSDGFWIFAFRNDVDDILFVVRKYNRIMLN